MNLANVTIEAHSIINIFWMSLQQPYPMVANFYTILDIFFIFLLIFVTIFFHWLVVLNGQSYVYQGVRNVSFFEKCRMKHLCWSLFLIELQTIKTLLQRKVYICCKTWSNRIIIQKGVFKNQKPTTLYLFT